MLDKVICMHNTEANLHQAWEVPNAINYAGSLDGGGSVELVTA